MEEESVDSVIQEVRKIKTKLARKFDFDVSRMAQDIRSRQGASGHAVVSRKKKVVTVTTH